MTKKKLFQITDTRTKKPVDGEYFDGKLEAKKRRQELNGATVEGSTNPNTWPYIVSPGPDHRHYQHAKA